MKNSASNELKYIMINNDQQVHDQICKFICYKQQKHSLLHVSATNCDRIQGGVL